jgi:hypothetical protein
MLLFLVPPFSDVTKIEARCYNGVLKKLKKC